MDRPFIDTTAAFGAARRGAQAVTAQALLDVIAGMLRELRGTEGPPPALDDDLERTLGIDSLARMELMLRLESAFDVRLPEALVQAAQTPRELLRAAAAAAPRPSAFGGRPPAATPSPAAGAAKGAAPSLPHPAQTMLDVLGWHAVRAPETVQLTVLDDEGARPVTHAALRQRGQAVAAALQASGVEPGDPVALMLATGTDFFDVFAGIWLAGAVPVPIYPPFRAAQIEDHLQRQTRILDNAGAVLLVSDERAAGAARLLKAGVASLRAVVTPATLREHDGTPRRVSRSAQDTALLQYTSGSTGQPKGVVLTHANLLANVRATGEALRASPADVFVSWLPLYHDMGLIGAWMATLYHAVPLVVMPPQAFLARPSRWLRAIDEHGGTLSAAPNFAYEILATRVPDDELEGLDLSRWRAALNGAEPVHASTLERFVARFGRYGFARTAMMPVYGLAECGVGLAFPPLGRGPRIDRIDRDALHRDGQARPLMAGAAVAADAAAGADAGGRAMEVVCCGSPLPGHEIRIADEAGDERPDRCEGHVQFRGPSATSGYFRNPQATRDLFRGDWLETGDVGYIADGELYLTSRIKDLIIRGGHNLHPYDLEDAVGNLSGVRRGCVAVFGARDPGSATERVVVLAETRLAEPAQRAALHGRIAELSIALLGTPADDIVLAGPHTVLKTSSGKIRRAACRALYEQGALAAGARPVAWQFMRLWAGAFGRRVREPARRVASAAEGLWLWGVFLLGAIAGVCAALWPGRPQRKQAARAVAGAVVRAARLPLTVTGTEYLATRPAIIAANHASYADWLVLTAVLPADACFVAKRELAGNPVLRRLLERLGVRFVEREAVQASVDDARRLVAAARAGETLVFFPEGTLTRAPGLRAFHLGAFVAAAEAGVPVLPVSVSGMRSVLRDGSWWPHRHPVQVQVHAPLHANGPAWADAVHLRDAVRDRIASTCGEPLLHA